MVKREDFFESHSTFLRDLDMPLGSYEQFWCGGVECCIRFCVKCQTLAG